MANSDDNSEFDENEALYTEYYEEALGADERAKVEKRLAEDEDFAAGYRQFVKTMEMLSGLHKMSAPMNFDKKVEETIHRRSDGRFFGRRAFGDRIPYEWLAVFVLLLAGAVYYMGRTSGTGGHRLQKDEIPAKKDADRDVVPRL